MFDSDRVYSGFVACWQVQMLLLQKTLVYKGLLNILPVELLLQWILEQILIQVLHDTVFHALAVQLNFFLGVGVAHREELCELFLHVVHQLLHMLSLLFSFHVWLDYLRQRGLYKLFDLLPNGQCLVAFKFVVEVVEDALLRSLLLRLFDDWFLLVFVRIMCRKHV